jgi:hypothetical protein
MPMPFHLLFLTIIHTVKIKHSFILLSSQFAEACLLVSCCALFYVRCFLFAEWFGTAFREFASIFIPRNGIPSCFLFRGRARNGISRVCFYFVLRNGIPSCSLFRGRVWNGIPRGFCSKEQPENLGK